MSKRSMDETPQHRQGSCCSSSESWVELPMGWLFMYCPEQRKHTRASEPCGRYILCCTYDAHISRSCQQCTYLERRQIKPGKDYKREYFLGAPQYVKATNILPSSYPDFDSYMELIGLYNNRDFTYQQSVLQCFLVSWQPPDPTSILDSCTVYLVFISILQFCGNHSTRLIVE
jgi:hypothetical protein